MDPFKVLTRSTKIPKSSSTSGNLSSQHIPSAGYTTDLQLNPDSKYGGLSSLQNKPTRQSTKRKRTVPENEPYSDVPSGLDFSANGAGAQSLVEVDRLRFENEIHGKTKQSDGAPPILNEQERRPILKRHKLKTSLLNTLEGIEKIKKTTDDTGRVIRKDRLKDVRTQTLPEPLTTFGMLRDRYSISRRLAENMHAQGYKEPTEVQMGALPLLLGSDEIRGLPLPRVKRKQEPSRSEVDLLTVAPTGSGKTLAFMIHLIHGLLEQRKINKVRSGQSETEHGVRALIIVPTHELTDQVANEGRRLALGTGIRISTLKKGMRLHAELAEAGNFASGDLEPDNEKENATHGSVIKSDILVSTPLLLLHAISSKPSMQLSLPDVRYLVLDEADVLLDALFREQSLGIWTACKNPVLQTSLWSATIGASIESLAQSFILDRRRKLGFDSSKPHYIIRLIVGLKDSAIPNISHRLVYAATEQGKLLALRHLLHPSAESNSDLPSLQPPFLVFTQTIPRAIALHSELLYDIPVEAGGSARIAVLHSDLSDTARSNIMAGFRKGEIWILITTDLLSRGVDFRGMNGVINYDIPNTSASYVHRVGRTGRQGREGGVAITFYTKEDIPHVKNVANVIAASEKANRRSDQDAGNGLQDWLLNALPKVSKKTKKELKRKGAESRRIAVGVRRGREARKARISTKSGYERRLENRKKGAMSRNLRRQTEELIDGDASEEEWEGIKN